jgi:hypothetical protein
MAKKTTTSKPGVLFCAPCEYQTASFPRNGVTIGCKIPLSRCTDATRQEYFVDRTLTVRISTDSNVGDTPPLPGMEDEYPTIETTVKVSQHSINATHMRFSMGIAAGDIKAEFAAMVSNTPGSLYVLDANKRSGDPESDEEPDDTDE